MSQLRQRQQEYRLETSLGNLVRLFEKKKSVVDSIVKDPSQSTTKPNKQIIIILKNGKRDLNYHKLL